MGEVIGSPTSAVHSWCHPCSSERVAGAIAELARAVSSGLNDLGVKDQLALSVTRSVFLLQ